MFRRRRQIKAPCEARIWLNRTALTPFSALAAIGCRGKKVTHSVILGLTGGTIDRCDAHHQWNAARPLRSARFRRRRQRPFATMRVRRRNGRRRNHETAGYRRERIPGQVADRAKDDLRLKHSRISSCKWTNLMPLLIIGSSAARRADPLPDPTEGVTVCKE